MEDQAAEEAPVVEDPAEVECSLEAVQAEPQHQQQDQLNVQQQLNKLQHKPEVWVVWAAALWELWLPVWLSEQVLKSLIKELEQ